MQRQEVCQPGVPAQRQNSSLPELRPEEWSRPDWLMSLLLVVVTLLAYWPAWFGQPVWDDDMHNTRLELRSLIGLGRIWSEVGATQQYYPLAFSAFWVQHKMWGDSTLGCRKGERPRGGGGPERVGGEEPAIAGVISSGKAFP